MVVVGKKGRSGGGVVGGGVNVISGRYTTTTGPREEERGEQIALTVSVPNVPPVQKPCPEKNHCLRCWFELSNCMKCLSVQLPCHTRQAGGLTGE